MWFRIFLLVLLSALFLLTTVVFCFWFVYLLEMIRKKWNSYRHAYAEAQCGDHENQQYIEGFLARTEFVKYVFLFSINTMEWLSITFSCVAFVLNSTQAHYFGAQQNQTFNGTDESFYVVLVMTQGKTEFPSILASNFLFLSNNCILLNTILMASLCMYLAARFAQKSWIKSNKIPHLIITFSVCAIATQILASFCSVHIIAIWCNKLLTALSLLIAWKQYRKLFMVMNWSIVDLRVSANYALLARQHQMVRKSYTLFTILWIGLFMLFCSQLMGVTLLTIVIVLRKNNVLYLSLCESSHFSNPEYSFVLNILLLISLTFGTIGAAVIFIPYIGFGLSTMYVILGRLFRGKSGFKTHYHNELTLSLL